MKVRVNYGGGIFWLNVDTTPVAGAWEIGRRKAENPGRRAQGCPELDYLLSAWAVYHQPTGLVAAVLRGRRQAESLAFELAEVWNGESYNDAPLGIRNALYELCRNAPGSVKP